jgi:hypothetical protein
LGLFSLQTPRCQERRTTAGLCLALCPCPDPLTPRVSTSAAHPGGQRVGPSLSLGRTKLGERKSPGRHLGCRRWSEEGKLQGEFTIPGWEADSGGESGQSPQSEWRESWGSGRKAGLFHAPKKSKLSSRVRPDSSRPSGKLLPLLH